MINEVLSAFFVFSVIVISAYLIRHYVFTLTVLRHAKNNNPPNRPFDSAYEPTVSILIPAHNEDQVIANVLQKMTELTYPKNKLEVITIDDASNDNTGQIADEYAKEYAFIKVLHRNKESGAKGKAAALNAALKLATGEIIVCFDADYTPHPDVVHRLVEKFADPNVGAVQGRPVVLNEPQNVVTRLIALERIGGYRVDQEARDLLGLVPQFGGTVGAFRRSVAVGFGGFDESMLTEDTDLTFQIYLAGYRIRYAGDAECYEEAVASLKTYWRQRHRWAKGHMQVCLKHAFNVVKSKRMTFKEKIDGLLLLHIYFMPLVTLFSLFIGAYLIIAGSAIAGMLWFTVPISVYSFVGNYAPFFEVGIGAYLDGRKRAQWLAPLLIFSFFYNMLICAKAVLDLVADKLVGGRGDWEKTEHLGKGNRYIES
jgi:cellulose synthase/poly-beta-1,6-N-acetylglucosamine synthase-like glycosyltransferase